MREDKIEHGQIDQTQAPGSGRPEVSFAIPAWVYGKRAKGQQPPSSERTGPITGKGYLLKRPFDICLATIGLMIASPLWLIFATAIKLEDRGPILFLQDRWGKDKGKIRVYKFRTMVPNAVEKFGHMQALGNDPRVTRVGRLLRATTLDEMPQLLNIARGDMSWVGPRALPIDEIQVQEEGDLPDEAIPGFEARSKLSPGLTGITQIFAPRDIPRQQKYQYDAIYASSQSLWMDIRLIFLSLWITLRAKWEARGGKI